MIKGEEQETIGNLAAVPESVSSLPFVRRLRGRAASATLDAVRAANEATVAALAAALELRDDKTGSHARRVTAIALSIARVVDSELADDTEARFGYLLHDIGKIGIPDRILLKRAALTFDEKRIMETHTELGESLISSLPHLQGVAREVIVHHHERWDGRAIHAGLRARRSRSPRASSRWRMRSTRSRATGPTGER